MDKPRVHINNWHIAYSDYRRGLEPVGWAKDHPELGTGKVYTSRILNIDVNKMEVETKNIVCL